MTPHPRELGSPLTHPAITTDFSESQVEMITRVHADVDECLDELTDIHQITYEALERELLWPLSMPCAIPEEDEIPIAQYGTSNEAHFKTTYRYGLSHRYGRTMQAISGIHYNFSFSDNFWARYAAVTGEEDTQLFRNNRYLDLIRNFRRLAWLLIYLFGASPVVCRNFLRSDDHGLEPMVNGTFGLPSATSLRMGPLGYQSAAQANLNLQYNTLNEYAVELSQALTKVHPAYEALGMFEDGRHKQLNSALLQLEAELYGTIRPKRRSVGGKRVLQNIAENGIEYLEVRCMDIDPFTPIGITSETVRFLDVFLLYCLIETSPHDTIDSNTRNLSNQLAVVHRGGNNGLRLDDTTKRRNLESWSTELLASIENVAKAIDRFNDNKEHVESVQRQKEKLQGTRERPAGALITMLAQSKKSLPLLGVDLAHRYKAMLAHRGLPKSRRQEFQSIAKKSLIEQKSVEQQSRGSFAEYLDEYFSLPLPN